MNVSFGLVLSLLTVTSLSLEPRVTNGQNSCTGWGSACIKDQWQFCIH